MSESPNPVDPDQEEYAYAVTRKMFYWTLGGTIMFSATMIVFWYVWP